MANFALRDELERAINSIDASQKEIRKDIGDIKSVVSPIQATITAIQADLATKASLERHTALAERVSRIEGSPGRSSMNWLQIIIAGSGCLISSVLTVVTLVLGVIYFIVSNHLIK